MILLIWWSAIYSWHLHAQVPDTLWLPDIGISVERMRTKPIGSFYQKWDGQQLISLGYQSAADLLQNIAGTHVRNYGPGSLATVSVRGSSAAQNLVLWNGMPIQNPMLGQLDWSLQSLLHVDDVDFATGGLGSLWGSGAIGSIINFAVQPDYSRPWQWSSHTQLGSFGAFHQHFRLAWGNQHFHCRTRFTHQQAVNNFAYQPEKNLPVRRQSHAEYQQQVFSQDAFYQTRHKGEWSLRTWWQSAQREIPPTWVQNHSEAHQTDHIARMMLQYRQSTPRGSWKARIAAMEEIILYADPQLLLRSRNRFRRYISEISGTLHWKKHQLLWGHTQILDHGWSPSYADMRHSIATFASWQYRPSRWHTQLSLRQEWADSGWLPIIPTLGLDWHLTKRWTLQLNVARKFRLPTLNDLYWQPGGNPELLPEQGWSQELGLAHRAYNGKVSLNAYNRVIDNWILWSASPDNPFFSATNVGKVRSHGIEVKLAYTLALGKLRTTWDVAYAYNRSTHRQALYSPKIEKGDLLLYSPVHRANMRLRLGGPSFSCTYAHHFTGTTVGINEHIPAWQTGTFRVNYTFRQPHWKATFFLHIHNLWNAQYVIVERRPMPGRYFQFGIQLGSQHKFQRSESQEN